MILNREIIGLYILSSILEIVILVITFFDQTFLSLFLVIKIAILVLNGFFMSILNFSSSMIRIKKSQKKNKKDFLIEHKKYFFLMIFLISESMIFIMEYMYLHKISNPYISLFKSGIFGSKLMIARGSFIRLKKGIILIVLSLFLGVEMVIFSDMAKFSSGDVLIIVLSYLLIIFNLFCHQKLNLRSKKAIKIEKMKSISHALFEEMFSNNEKSIFILKNGIKSIKLEMINQKAASIFDLEIIRNIDYETLTKSFQTKFSGFSFDSCGTCNDINQTIIKFTKENKNSIESQKFPNTDQAIQKEDESFKTKRKISIIDLIEDFPRDQKIKKVEMLLKNRQEYLNHYRFEIIKVKHDEKNYFIFFIHNQSKIAEIENLKNINEFNNRLLCSLSHEIKTPINGALPNLEILKNNIDDDDLLELLEISIGSLKLLENSLDNIMAFNLLQADQIFLSKNKFALKDLINEISNILYPMIAIKKLNFSIQVENLEKIKLITDYIKLKQILLNLLTNAIQFTLEGDIVLKIDLEERLIKFSIHDTGIGMDFLKLSNLMKKLKEPNQENLKINSSGSCMGLLISEKLSILLGSEDGLRILSTLNKGSEFTFSVISNDNGVDISEEANTSKVCTTKQIMSSKSKSKSSASVRSSVLKVSSFIEDKKQSHLIEHKSKKSGFVPEDTENQGLKSIRSVGYLSNNYPAEECGKSKYNFEPLVKLFDHLDDPRKEKEQLNNPLYTDPNIKKIIFNNFNHLSVSYGNEKEVIAKSSPNTYAHIKQYLKKNDLMVGESDCISETANAHTKKKTCCDCEEVLYVDDDAFNLLSLELILKSFNLKCFKAMNGLEALKALEKRKCDNYECKGFKLIFMDYQMPIMDGIETTKNIMEMIRKNLINEVPIIGCTAFVSRDEILECYEVGMKDVIFKPLNINLVENIINEWL